MKWGDDIPAKYDLSRLRILGSVGEPINPEAYIWYREHIGGDRCPVVDTWWQTETGAIMISPLPGRHRGQAGRRDAAAAGHHAPTSSTTRATRCPTAAAATWCSREPWPSMLRTIWGDDQRYIDTYWSRFEGMYFAGDGAKKDEDGDMWLLGRVDDVMLVSGHNISTTEVESALVSPPEGRRGGRRGRDRPGDRPGHRGVRDPARHRRRRATDIATELRDHVAKALGPIAKPRQILVVPELPKTRSGKIMRRLLRDVAENRALGDVTTLADSTVMDLISEKLPSRQERGLTGGTKGRALGTPFPNTAEARISGDGGSRLLQQTHPPAGKPPRHPPHVAGGLQENGR